MSLLVTDAFSVLLQSLDRYGIAYSTPVSSVGHIGIAYKHTCARSKSHPAMALARRMVNATLIVFELDRDGQLSTAAIM